MKFSERIGKKPIRLELQRESMDEVLRISLWNVVMINYFENVEEEWISISSFNSFFRRLWNIHLKLPIDTLNDNFKSTYRQIRNWFFEWDWFEVYDFIEFIANNGPEAYKDVFVVLCNNALEREMSAYRFVNGEIVEITDKNEIDEIEEAITLSSNEGLLGVRAHLSSALSKLSDRKNPDYRNSIKESISAVESICQSLSGDSKAELGKALKIIEDKIGMHPALKKGFSAIYGYTSDEGGIRHAMLEEPACYFEDAKYMLVSCSAFINYLILKSNRVGIKSK